MARLSHATVVCGYFFYCCQIETLYVWANFRSSVEKFVGNNNHGCDWTIEKTVLDDFHRIWWSQSSIMAAILSKSALQRRRNRSECNSKDPVFSVYCIRGIEFRSTLSDFFIESNNWIHEKLIDQWLDFFFLQNRTELHNEGKIRAAATIHRRSNRRMPWCIRAVLYFMLSAWLLGQLGCASKNISLDCDYSGLETKPNNIE